MATINGDNNDNVLNGTANADTINGNGGNDTIDAGAGSDFIDAGSGDDYIDAGQSFTNSDVETINAGDGNDTIRAGFGADVIDGGAGIDTYSQGSRGTNTHLAIDLAAGTATSASGINQTITNFENAEGAFGNDTITGTAGDNTLDGQAGDDVLNGGAGNDSLLGGDGDDSLFGGSGNDTIDAGAGFGNDSLSGGTGDDSIIAGDGADTVIGGDGNDYIDIRGSSYGQSFDTVDAGAGNDTVIGSFFQDSTIDGGDGTDTLIATPNANNNTNFNMETGVLEQTNIPSGTTHTSTATNFENATTGAGDDAIVGTDGDNILISDVFDNAAGNDSIWAQGGNDTVEVGAGDDYVNAGTGDDFVIGEEGNDSIVGEAGNDSIFGGSGNDTLKGGAGADSIHGGSGEDSIKGNAGNDTINGAAGNDTIEGGSGDDTVDGGDGNDLIQGDITAGDTVELNSNTFDTSDEGWAYKPTPTSPEEPVEYDPSGGLIAVTDDIGGRGYLIAPPSYEGDQSLLIGGSMTFDLTQSGSVNETPDEGVQIVGLVDGVETTISYAPSFNVINGQTTTNTVDFVASNFTYANGTTVSDADFEQIMASISEFRVRAEYSSNANDSVSFDNFVVTSRALAEGEGEGNDSLSGDAGEDTIFGNGGDDTIDGGADNDTIDGGTGNDSLLGGTGEDSIVGGTGEDTIDGGTGNDSIDGGVGSDTIDGGDGNDTIDGGMCETELVAGGTTPDYVEQEATNSASNTITTSFTNSNGDTVTVTHSTDDGNYDAASAGPVTNAHRIDAVGETNTHNFSEAVSGAQLHFSYMANGEKVSFLFTFADGQVMTLSEAIAAGRVNVDTSASDETVVGDELVGGGTAGNADSTYVNITYPLTDFSVESTGGYAGAIAYELFADANAPVEVDVAGTGDDSIMGGAGDDVIDGQCGNDTIDGGADADSILGGTGQDSILGGTGNDTIDGGADNDTIDGGADDDSILGGAGEDNILGGDGADTVDGGADNDIIDGGAGNDSLDGGFGDDSVCGGDGNDTISGGESEPAALPEEPTGSTEHQFTIIDPAAFTTLNGSSLFFPSWQGEFQGTTDTVQTITISDVDSATNTGNAAVGNNSAIGPDTDQTLELATTSTDQAFNDSDNGGGVTSTGGQTLVSDFNSPTYGTIPAGSTILTTTEHRFEEYDENGTYIDDFYVFEVTFGYGGTTETMLVSSKPLVNGHTYESTSRAGQGTVAYDELATFTVADPTHGDDTLCGGEGDDTFLVVEGNDTITDFNLGNTGAINDGDQTNNDFVDLSGYYNQANYDAAVAAGDIDPAVITNPLDWLQADQADDGILNDTNAGWDADNTLTIQNGGSAVAGSDLTFDNTNVVCFTRGTLIKTINGEVPVEELATGDHVMTVDNGYQPVRWIGARKFLSEQLTEHENLRPVRIRAGALGNGLPETDLLVSQQHRILICSKIAQRMFDGHSEVLVAAKHLVLIDGIDIVESDGVEYYHFLFDNHQVVFSNGARTESMYTGPEALKTVSPEAREEILTIFPEVASIDYEALSCRPLANGRMGRKLAMRHKRGGRGNLDQRLRWIA